MIIRLYTEDTNRDRIHAICQEHLVGYTLIPCEGIWKGAKEQSLVIEVIDSPLNFPRKACQKVARAIKRVNKQEAVLLTIVREDEQFCI